MSWKFMLLSMLTISLFANAQKQPQVQNTSILAPINITIDGKLNEWNEKLQAYNPVDRVYYVISNDSENLYLTVHGPGMWENEKFFFGGITFTISHSLQKSITAQDNISVKFPLLDYKSVLNIVGPLQVNSNLKNDTITNYKKIDSILFVSNKKAKDAMKEIQVIGIKEITDPAISIYNENGIKAMAQFDKKMNFVYELAIPLKYLNQSINNPVKFSYNIKMNGLPPNPHPGHAIEMDPANLDLNWEESPTDFWGEYTLAKKP